jgi:hypothetical protein
MGELEKSKVVSIVKLKKYSKGKRSLVQISLISSAIRIVSSSSIKESSGRNRMQKNLKTRDLKYSKSLYFYWWMVLCYR